MGKDWDDVIPCALPDIGSRRGEEKALEVSQKKSKLGLGELYKQEYLKKAVRLHVDAKEN